jgi:hypothetical protein
MKNDYEIVPLIRKNITDNGNLIQYGGSVPAVDSMPYEPHSYSSIAYCIGEVNKTGEMESLKLKDVVSFVLDDITVSQICVVLHKDGKRTTNDLFLENFGRIKTDEGTLYIQWYDVDSDLQSARFIYKVDEDDTSETFLVLHRHSYFSEKIMRSARLTRINENVLLFTFVDGVYKVHIFFNPNTRTYSTALHYKENPTIKYDEKNNRIELKFVSYKEYKPTYIDPKYGTQLLVKE